MVNFEEKCTIAQFGSSEFGKIIMNHQKVHFVASTKSHDFVKLTAITNKAKMNLQNVLNQNQKRPYSVLVFNPIQKFIRYTNCKHVLQYKPKFSSIKSMIEAYKRFIQNMTNSLVQTISNQHKPLLFLAKFHMVQNKPNFVKLKQRETQIQTKPIDHIITHYWIDITCLTIQSPNFIHKLFISSN